jgi:hypothetical protein
MWRWVICAAALMLAGCSSTERLHYKMVVEVETPEGLMRGFSVREVTYDPGGSWFPLGESRPSAKLVGEAVAVDLPGGRTLFALLKGANGRVDYSARDIRTLLNERGDSGRDGVVELWPAMPETKAPQIGNPLPLLVTFQDLSDPKTIGPVDPRNLGATFGPGISLKRITIERTSETVTSGIEKTVPWLETVGRSRSTLIPNPPRLLKDATPISLVAPSDFSTELYK